MGTWTSLGTHNALEIILHDVHARRTTVSDDGLKGGVFFLPLATSTGCNHTLGWWHDLNAEHWACIEAVKKADDLTPCELAECHSGAATLSGAGTSDEASVGGPAPEHPSAAMTPSHRRRTVVRMLRAGKHRQALEPEMLAAFPRSPAYPSLGNASAPSAVVDAGAMGSNDEDDADLADSINQIHAAAGGAPWVASASRRNITLIRGSIAQPRTSLSAALAKLAEPLAAAAATPAAGASQSPVHERASAAGATGRAAARARASLDWRTHRGGGWLSPVRDVLRSAPPDCPAASFAFAAISAVEARIRIASNRSQSEHLSAADVLACSPYASRSCDAPLSTYMVGKVSR